jgi:hypothetical protein
MFASDYLEDFIKPVARAARRNNHKGPITK